MSSQVKYPCGITHDRPVRIVTRVAEFDLTRDSCLRGKRAGAPRARDENSQKIAHWALDEHIRACFGTTMTLGIETTEELHMHVQAP